MLTVWNPTLRQAEVVTELNAEKDLWINVVQPNIDEIKLINRDLRIPGELIKDVLDTDETPRSEVDGKWLVIIYRVPVYERENEETPYNTVPLGIFISRDVIVTICTRDNEILEDFREGRQKNFNPAEKFRFVLQIFQRSATYYLRYLKRINKITEQIEKELIGSVRNRELVRMLKIEKSLVYFTTSLKANQLLLHKLQRSRITRLGKELQDDMEDVLIDTEQAIEMTNVYNNILSGMMDAFASIISNNLNVVMKSLTSITIILMIPTLVASIYGMNVDLPFQQSKFAFLIVILLSAILSGIGIWFFRRRKLF